MHGKRFLVPALAGLLVIVLLLSGVSAMQRNAWSQGYMLGRLSTGSGGGRGGAADALRLLERAQLRRGSAW